MTKENSNEMVSRNAPMETAARIVIAYVSNNPVPARELPDLIKSVHSAMTSLRGQSLPSVNTEQQPAVEPAKSVHDDYIVCLEDGKKYKSLRRHLNTQYGMTPEQYRKKWGLPSDYPMVSRNYAEVRSELAKRIGLGQRNG